MLSNAMKRPTPPLGSLLVAQRAGFLPNVLAGFQRGLQLEDEERKQAT
jgi:hypothetical protein